MELLAYICALTLYFNIFGAAVLFLDFAITEVWYSVQRFSKRKKGINREAN